ncbi:hypothetical protein EVJ58_g1107 [Rhodofomes roseus]|uniref:Ribosome biogenesis protein NOP53 n=1 Tax=Rhodofomes roseus TaxID=34475 RepID=A0A4Y9Z316_9APHY|nr:hypothetical protein EVJ58_g1107 [Rhodofomes roseus]
MFCYTLHVQSEGYSRNRGTRVFLCASGPDESGKQALDWALESLVQDGDELIVFRGVDSEELEKEHDQYREDARDLMRYIQEKCVEDDAERKLSIIVEYIAGKVPQTIDRLISLYRPDSIVVGTRGQRGMMQAWGAAFGAPGKLGSVSRYCLSHSPVPIIVVRPEEKVRKTMAKRRADPKRGSHFEKNACLAWRPDTACTALYFTTSNFKLYTSTAIMAVKPTTKAMHNSPSNKGKKAASSIGAPAQHNQSSRKGKKAWRKNVDIGDVEVGMEELREEERVTGSILQKKTNEELFQVDVKGDEHIRRTQPKFSKALLTSTKILAQRSAVPAVITRTTANPLKRKNLTYEEKGRLLRMGKRPRKGPFNAVIDHTEMGAGSAMLEVSEAAKNSGTHDVWGDSSVQGTKVKHPKTPNPRSLIALPAVPTPHEGTSYNPLVTSHLELLRTAHEIEERRLKETEKLAEMKRRGGCRPGDDRQLIDDADAELEADDGKELPPVKKMPERKTKQERRKASRLRAEKRALAERAARKRMLASVDSAKALRKAFGRNLAARERLRVQKQEKMQEKLRQGLAGQRLGKHKVPEGEVDVQLGEELTESLRALKPEGNLFRDRFLSMQHRALIEPRVPVLPRRRKMKIKEYEKHSYKRFDRDQ